MANEPKQLLLALAAQMAKQIPLSELPRHKWKICWTTDTHLNHNHACGGSGVTEDFTEALTKQEAEENFLRDSGANAPFILVIHDLGKVGDQ